MRPVVPYGGAAVCGLHQQRPPSAWTSGPAHPFSGQSPEYPLLLDEHHPQDPHEYLWFLGVVPAAQGHGIGSALMAPVLERADRAGAPAYLEATSPRNRALYERHGFEPGPAIAVGAGPPMWPMWRRPS